MNRVKILITALRTIMYEKIENHGVNSREALDISKRLDYLIVEYQRNI